VPPYFATCGRTFSGVTARTRTKRADVPGWMVDPGDLMNSSLMP